MNGKKAKEIRKFTNERKYDTRNLKQFINLYRNVKTHYKKTGIIKIDQEDITRSRRWSY